jgi:primosomal protein N' (replication factor Y)
MTFHKKFQRLVCHYCGTRISAPSKCKACGEQALEPIGTGTERVEEDFRKMFPGVSLDVLDRDTARQHGGAAAVLERFGAGRSQVLIGTQMVSKGHHFPNVVLTAVLSADSYLGFPDFRAVEKTYCLLTQLAGRAGRGERPGKVVIQTFNPDHYAIRAALNHDDEGFALEETRFRRTFHYPPFSRMVQLVTRDKKRERAEARIQELAAEIERRTDRGQVRVNGPAPAPLERLRGQWRFQLLVRTPTARLLRQLITDIVLPRTGSDLVIDVDPYDLM